MPFKNHYNQFLYYIVYLRNILNDYIQLSCILTWLDADKFV